VLAHLWTKAPAPAAYIEFVLCDRFKVLPSQLRRERGDDVLTLLACMNAEAEVQRMEAQKKKHG
jgi:hypothetical protein